MLDHHKCRWGRGNREQEIKSWRGRRGANCKRDVPEEAGGDICVAFTGDGAQRGQRLGADSSPMLTRGEDQGSPVRLGIGDPGISIPLLLLTGRWEPRASVPRAVENK